VVIATVFLCIIAMSGGWALGSRHQTPDTPDDSALNQVPTPISTGTMCPQQIRDTASRLGLDDELTQVLKVRANRTGTLVWICRNTAGRLYYQSLTGGDESDWEEGRNALFLGDTGNVVEQGDGYLATAKDGNTFKVDERRLVTVVRGEKQTYSVTPE
jgi:hypothetical protein